MRSHLLLFLIVVMSSLLLVSCDRGNTESGLVAGNAESLGDIPLSGDGIDAMNSCYHDYVHKYPDLLAAYNASGAVQTIEAWGKAHYNEWGRGEGRSLAASCTRHITADYNFLYKHNAYLLSGHTVRWPQRIIQVSGSNKRSWERAASRWVSVSFSFVSETSNGINIIYRDLPPKVCGNAAYSYRSNGEITKCTLSINTKIRNMNCGKREDLVLTHEFGHCIGFSGHISTPGLMDPDCCEEDITLPVRNMFSLLYSLPMGTNINSRVTQTVSAKNMESDEVGRAGSQTNNLYDPDGKRTFTKIETIYESAINN